MNLEEVWIHKRGIGLDHRFESSRPAPFLFGLFGVKKVGIIRSGGGDYS